MTDDSQPWELAMFRKSVPPGFVEHVARMVIQAERTAWQLGASLPDGHRHDKFAYDYRWNVETGLWHLKDAFAKNGVTAVIVPNKVGNWHHTEVRIGRIVLTASAVDGSDTMARDADFRQSLAKNPQMPLGIVPAEDDPPSVGLYAVLLYPSSSFRQTKLTDPRFIYFRFPTSDCLGYLAGRVNALAELRASEKAAKPTATPKPQEKRKPEAS